MIASYEKNTIENELFKFILEYDPIEVILFIKHSDIRMDSLLKGRSVVTKHSDTDQYKSYFQTKWLKQVILSVYEETVFIFLSQTNFMSQQKCCPKQKCLKQKYVSTKMSQRNTRTFNVLHVTCKARSRLARCAAFKVAHR